MRLCNTVEELVLAHDHLDTISPRGIAAFWSSLVKHVQNHRGGNSRAQVNEQLAEILCNTLENRKRYSYRDISTIAISLAKIMKTSGISWTKRRYKQFTPHSTRSSDRWRQI